MAMSVTYVLWFFGLGIYVPYFPIWLTDRGFDASTIGVLLAVPMIVRIVAITPVAHLGDGRLGARRTFLLLATGAAFAYLGLILTDGFWSVAVMLALVALFTAGGVPILDAIVLNGIDRHGLDYGRIRFWGSTSWLAANLAGGAVLGQLPPSILPPLLAALAALSALAALRMPRDGGSGRKLEGIDGQSPSRRLFAAFAIGIALIQGAHAFLLGFSTLMWEQMGYSAPQIGLLWSIGILIEMAFFLWGTRAARLVAPIPMILIGAACGAVRWILMGFEPTSPIIITLLQSTHFLTYAAVHLATMNWLGRYPVGRTRLSGWIATSISIAMALTTILSGTLFENVGAQGFFAMTALSLGGFCFIAWAGHLERQGDARKSPSTNDDQPHSAGSGG